MCPVHYQQSLLVWLCCTRYNKDVDEEYTAVHDGSHKLFAKGLFEQFCLTLCEFACSPVFVTEACLKERNTKGSITRFNCRFFLWVVVAIDQ